MHAPGKPVDLVVVSDVHLGTYGSHARELNKYLKSVHPKTLVLNGDIIDIWQFSKWYWPRAHTKVLKRILKLMAEGTRVIYITGNHDEALRRFTPLHLGDMEVVDQLWLELDGKHAWFFHGDVLDLTMQHAPWLAKLGAIGYDTLIVLNRFVNYVSRKLGFQPVSISQRVKNGVKSAVKFISHFEKTACEMGKLKGADYVVCGHIHQPAIVPPMIPGGPMYLNSGDWIENLSALEYHQGAWKMVHFDPEFHPEAEPEDFETGIPNMQFVYETIIRHSGNR